MQLTKKQIEQADRIWRLNLINSISGIKPANLIGTKSIKGVDNLAIFSSVVHLGSNPALLGMVARPQTDALKDTFRNIMETGFYTINHVPKSLIQKAHYTSAKLPSHVSEFERMNIGKKEIGDFFAPFVEQSPIKIGMKHLQNIPLPNDCIFIIGSVELIEYPDESINEAGQLDLEKSQITGISGLNTYYGLEKLETFPYVRITDIPEFK